MATTRSLRKKKPEAAFYEAPSQRTSAKIIADARKSVRSLPTARPFTPAEASRNLFGGGGGGAGQSRPPSVYSIGARHFTDERLSRPPTGRLEPIEKSLSATEQVKKAAAKRERPTPPTPVQSLYDLTARSQTHSQPQQGLHEPDELEPKPSQFSPPLSKRSLSAGKRVLSGGAVASRSGCIRRGSGRAHSAGSKSSKGSESQPTTTGKDGSLISASSSSSHQQFQPTATNKALSSSSLSSSQQPLSKKHRSSSSTSSSSSSIVPVWEGEVAPLLSELDSTPYSQEAHLCQLVDTLWSALETHNILGRGGGAGGSKRRARVLRSVFKLLDHKYPKLLMKVAKIILAMRVTGKNMTNVCKLLFSLAKNEQNDTLFVQEQIAKQTIELLTCADLASDSEALVYGLGTVKLLASNAQLREQLAGGGVMDLATATLQGCTENSSVDKSHASNILVQLTGALRNLSDSSLLRDSFVCPTFLTQLATVLSSHMTTSDIVFNISRLLSKLSQQAEFQQTLLNCSPLIPHFLQALTTHSSHTDIVVRICFVLGNLTSSNAEAREMLFFSHSPLPLFNKLLVRYLTAAVQEKQQGLAKQADKEDASDTQRLSQAEDVLIKLVRLVANLSVHPEVGPAIASDDSCVDSLLKILAELSLESCEELVLNTLVTLNNLSYYAKEDSAFERRHCELAELLVAVIIEDNSDGLLECCRVYGNLSRHPDVRQLLAEKSITELMVTVLDSGSREMVYSACGVLLNLMADESLRKTVAHLGGVKKLVEVLEDFGHSDWQLASLVCKTLWNYSENTTSADSLFAEDESGLLVSLLQLYIAEPSSSSEKQLASGVDLATIAWETEFLPVAKDLLSRLQSHHSNLIPLPTVGVGGASSVS